MALKNRRQKYLSFRYRKSRQLVTSSKSLLQICQRDWVTQTARSRLSVNIISRLYLALTFLDRFDGLHDQFLIYSAEIGSQLLAFSVNIHVTIYVQTTIIILCKWISKILFRRENIVPGSLWQMEYRFCQNTFVVYVQIVLKNRVVSVKKLPVLRHYVYFEWDRFQELCGLKIKWWNKTSRHKN